MKLSNLITLKYGKSQKKVESQSGYPIYGTGGIMGYANTYLYNKETILFGRKGSISNVQFIKEPFWCVDTTFFSIINEDIVIPKYLYYNLSTIDFNIYNEGTTIPSLRVDTLNEIDIEIHDKSTQQHIVNIIGSIDDYIENLQQEILSFTAIGKEIFKLQSNMYTIKTKDILNFQKGVEVGSKEYLDVKNENTIEYFRVADLNNTKSETFVNTIFLEKASAKFGDVMITFDGCPGRVGYCVKGCFSGSIRKIIDINKKYNNGYLYFWSVSENVQNCIKEHSFGTTILHASKAIEHLEIIDEPNEEILNQLNIIFEKMVSNNLIIQTLNKLKQSYLKKFFG